MTGRDCFYTDDFMFNIMGIEDLPTTLYQYTSVESLEKILETRSLRFSRLDTMNDPEEATAADLPHAASSVFVSCWSAGEAEHIPMWSMYGRNFAGVRIRLPSNMFSGRRKPIVHEKGGALSTFDGIYSIKRKVPAMSTSGRGIIGPNKIWYSDDPAYRNRKLVSREEGMARFNPYDLGMVKGTYWSYEQEWRFKIAALPFETQFPDDQYLNNVALDLGTYPIETEALFIPLDPSALDELEVTIGGRADHTVIEAVECILAEHAPRASLARSQIPIR
ncbi:DUF2971 domain-containing protein [Microvirga terricola]|uniref:DUF2971 domain-containing protein n=1 Tax=Microvirga terricola TaxID=2719797 RepID=A0ABX0V642_9HYPH|nr:DUF2971 domain-containing protein [Microvirga terricola]NIX75269.1 DUF2971 domain-containing protein [Microvirga terricola]